MSELDWGFVVEDLRGWVPFDEGGGRPSLVLPRIDWGDFWRQPIAGKEPVYGPTLWGVGNRFNNGNSSASGSSIHWETPTALFPNLGTFLWDNPQPTWTIAILFRRDDLSGSDRMRHLLFDPSNLKRFTFATRASPATIRFHWNLNAAVHIEANVADVTGEHTMVVTYRTLPTQNIELYWDGISVASSATTDGSDVHDRMDSLFMGAFEKEQSRDSHQGDIGQLLFCGNEWSADEVNRWHGDPFGWSQPGAMALSFIRVQITGLASVVKAAIGKRAALSAMSEITQIDNPEGRTEIINSIGGSTSVQSGES